MKRKNLKIKEKYTRCPCCKAEIKGQDMLRTLNLFFPDKDKPKQIDFRHFRELSSYQWACDQGLNNNVAFIGNPKNQLYLDHGAYLAYFDLEKKCSTCLKPYVFSKKEQLYWYESLGFWAQSKPNHCQPCRKSLRKEKNINNELTTLLKDKNSLDITQCNRLAEIYMDMNKPEKMKFYISLAKKIKTV